MRKALKYIGIVFEILLLIIALVGGSLLSWFRIHFGVSFEEILYTLASPMKGANLNPVTDAVKYCAVAIISTVLIAILFIMAIKLDKKIQINLNVRLLKFKTKINVIAAFLILTIIASCLGSVSVLYKTEKELKIIEYVKAVNEKTHIYEDYYVWPDVASIQADKPKNLIYIYLESMESTFSDTENGGRQEINYIPNLTQLANENIMVSNGDKMGGFKWLPGTSWTAAALFSTQSAIPFSYPVEGNYDMGERENFAKNLITLGDILEEKGYYQEFLCGSNADFGGRKALFSQHGNFTVMDYFECVKQGYIEEGYSVNWGFEDEKLYDIAKKELDKIAKNKSEPFNFTMLTVDTHFPSGYLCELCGNKYPEKFANVLDCADSQVMDFVEWCKEQDWYKDTVIVIQGDHIAMGTDLVEGLERTDRTVYNCFINSDIDKTDVNIKNREFSHMDMMPSILHAMGYSIPGDRIGLGTDLFSDTPTLVEKLGYDYLNTELRKYSSYYIENFS